MQDLYAITIIPGNAKAEIEYKGRHLRNGDFLPVTNWTDIFWTDFTITGEDKVVVKNIDVEEKRVVFDFRPEIEPKWFKKLSTSDLKDKKAYEKIDMQIDGLGYLGRRNFIFNLNQSKREEAEKATGYSCLLPVSHRTWTNANAIIWIILASDTPQGYDLFYYPSISSKPMDIIELNRYIGSNWLEPCKSRQESQTELAQMIENELKAVREKSQIEETEIVVQKDKNGYYIEKNDVKRYITDFTIAVKKEYYNIDNSEDSFIEAMLTNRNGKQIDKMLQPKDFDEVKSFKTALNSGYFNLLTTSSLELNALKRYVYDGNYEIQYIASFGGVRRIREDWYYIEAQNSLQPIKKNLALPEVNSSEVNQVYMLDTNIPHIDVRLIQDEFAPLTADEVELLNRDLFNFNSKKITVQLLGYLSATFFKERLNHLGIRVPNLLIIGEAGSGKSQTVQNIAYPFLGLDKSYNATSITKFAMDALLASNTTVPIVLDEFKPYKMEKWRLDLISESIRASYDRLVSVRGTKNLKSKELKARTNFILIGEASTDETAVLERSIVLNFSKRYSRIPEATESFMTLKKHKPLLAKLGRILAEASITLNDTVIETFYQSSKLEIPTSIEETRVIDGLSFVTFGLLMLEFVCKVANKENTFDEMVQFMVENALENIGCNSKSIVDITLEQMDIGLPAMRQMTPHSHKLYQVINDGTQLAIDFKALYPLYTKYLKDYKLNIDVLPYNDFLKQLRLKNYFVEYKNVRFSAVVRTSTYTKVTKAMILDLGKMQELQLELSNFTSNPFFDAQYGNITSLN